MLVYQQKDWLYISKDSILEQSKTTKRTTIQLGTFLLLLKANNLFDMMPTHFENEKKPLY